MPRRVKKQGVIVEIPEVWETTDGSGKSVSWPLGGGRIKIFNILDREEADIRKKTGSLSFVNDDNGVPRQATKTDEIGMREEIMLARLSGNGNDCYWDGFENENGDPMGCTEKNIRIWAYETPLYLFVCHVGKLLDAVAENLATEEEKNSLNSLVQQPGAANESTKAGAKNAGKAGRKE